MQCIYRSINNMFNTHTCISHPLGVIWEHSDESLLTINIHYNGSRSILKDCEDEFTWLSRKLWRFVQFRCHLIVRDRVIKSVSSKLTLLFH